MPVTVKMRLGWDDDNLTAPYFAREFEKVGVAAVTIHGRTREQGFSGGVNLDGIRRVVEAVERIPVIGNGDVRTIADAARMFEETGCHGIAIGRGALPNPWIFRQLVELGADRRPRPARDLRGAVRVHAAARPPARASGRGTRSTAASSSARWRRGTRGRCGCRRRCSSGS